MIPVRYSHQQRGSQVNLGRSKNLAALGVTEEFILSNCYLRDGDIVFVAGTLVEGIGNSFSDIDVYVITDRRRKVREVDISRHHRVITPTREMATTDIGDEDVFLIHTVSSQSLIKIDIEFKTFEEAEEIFFKVEEIFNYATKHLILLTKNLADREEVFIHRMMNSIPVHNKAGFENLLGRISPEKYAYVSYRWVASDYSKLLDVLGAWHAKEFDRLVDLCRESVIQQLSGYLRLQGITNLRRKWLMTYVKALNMPAEFFDQLTSLLYFQDVGSDKKKQEYAESALDLIDEIYDMSRPLLAEFKMVPSGQDAIAELVREAKLFGSDSRYSSWEFEYRSRAYVRIDTPTKALFNESPTSAQN